MILPIAAATVSVALYAATPALAAAVVNFRELAHDRQVVSERPRAGPDVADRSSQPPRTPCGVA